MTTQNTPKPVYKVIFNEVYTKRDYSKRRSLIPVYCVIVNMNNPDEAVLIYPFNVYNTGDKRGKIQNVTEFKNQLKKFLNEKQIETIIEETKKGNILVKEYIITE